MKYTVEITEILQKFINMEANTEEEARRKVEQLYKNGDIVLDADDFVSSEINSYYDFGK